MDFFLFERAADYDASSSSNVEPFRVQVAGIEPAGLWSMLDAFPLKVTIMANDKMMAQISGRDSFIAALDQSGGSTPGALRLYGIPDSAYSGDAEMFRLMHEMRVLSRRVAIMTASDDKTALERLTMPCSKTSSPHRTKAYSPRPVRNRQMVAFAWPQLPVSGCRRVWPGSAAA